jgi:hypothetical protein
MFTGGSQYIHILLNVHGRIIKNASIKGQCAKSRFYGTNNIEMIFSQLEANHSKALRQIIDQAWSPQPEQFESKHLAWLWEAILFQHARTELQIKKTAPAIGAFWMELFKDHLKRKADSDFYSKFIKEVKDGHVTISEPPQATSLRSIEIAMEGRLLISDLDLHILRNFSDYPFVFSDSPVVFCNTYYQNVTNRGVLGLQTPGLQIFYPLDSATMVMLSDDNVYKGNQLKSIFIDITERSDISQLNAIQLHHSMNTIYFAYADDEEYITSLWWAHKNRIIPPKIDFRMREGWLVDGKPPEGTLYQIYEPQLNIKLDLSFIECAPAKAKDFKFRRRNPELVEEHKKQILEKEHTSTRRISKK